MTSANTQPFNWQSMPAKQQKSACTIQKLRNSLKYLIKKEKKNIFYIKNTKVEICHIDKLTVIMYNENVEHCLSMHNFKFYNI